MSSPPTERSSNAALGWFEKHGSNLEAWSGQRRRRLTFTTTPEVLPVDLTVDDAADLLNVSRAHLLELVASGALPSRRRGQQQRLALVDVLAHRDLIDSRAGRALDAMTLEAEDAGLYG